MHAVPGLGARVFVTGGEGPIPALALLAERPPVEETEGRLLQLLPSTSARLLVPLKRADDFLDLARRGFYAYDWSDVHRTRSERVGRYEQIAAPKVPLVAAELSPEMASLLRGITLNVTFTQDTRIDVAKELRCREPE